MRANIFSYWEKLKKFAEDESVEAFAKLSVSPEQES